MKKSYSQKHPYITVILLGLLCTFMTGLGTAIPQIIGLDTNLQIIVTTLFLVASVGIGIVIMIRSRFRLVDYGFRNNEKESYHKVWWYLPLVVVIVIIPIVINGFVAGISIIQYIIVAFFTIAVGFNEEIYFRGLAFKFLEEKGKKKAIICSSVIFGILHLANVLNGKDVVYLILQMFFAFLVGFVFAEIVSITKSLWIVIICHAAYDYISSITGENIDSKAVVVLAIQVCVLMVYAISIWKLILKDDVASQCVNVNEVIE